VPELPDAVLFDFSGTLFHIESAEQALRAALGPRFVHLAADLERLGAINGSGTPDELPDHLARVWAERDLSADAHRAAYSGLSIHAGLTPAQARLLYDRGIDADAWRPYPDTAEVLSRLGRAGVPVAVVSNIGWDLRPVLDQYGVADEFAALVLSYERGVMKPDAAIFRTACAELNVRPRGALMVGDTPGTDGAAVDIGCRFELVPSDPQRPADTLLRAVGLAGGHQPEYTGRPSA
jgi:putative hydrolase of the HAD superfamily